MKVRVNRKLDSQMLAVVEKRNALLREFFVTRGLDVELTGDAENPMIVLGHAVSLAAYVKNFDLIFLDKPYDGTVTQIFSLKDDVDVTREEVLELIQYSVHTGLLRIQEKKSGYLLAGYNFKDSQNRRGRFPVFARDMCIFYKTLERANEMCAILKDDGYLVEVVKPELERLKVHIGFKPQVQFFATRPLVNRGMDSMYDD